MRKEIITCDRCKKGLEQDNACIVATRDLCIECFDKYQDLDNWFEAELEKWLDGKENELPV